MDVVSRLLVKMPLPSLALPFYSFCCRCFFFFPLREPKQPRSMSLIEGAARPGQAVLAGGMGAWLSCTWAV